MKASELVDQLAACDLRFITGVPDSIFQNFLTELLGRKGFQHFISSNEGEACAIAAGYQVSTGRVPVVYMQNAGLGNCINPLTSLIDSQVYAIPVLLLISWRGKPGTEDQPQHKRMGDILPSLLQLLDIPFRVLAQSSQDLQQSLTEAMRHFQNQSSPFAILFSKDTIAPIKKTPLKPKIPVHQLTRKKILEAVVDGVDDSDILVSTTGMTSRELFEIRERKNKRHQQDFLMVGSMGCSSAFAAGLALNQPQRRVILLDGDGACLMRMETMAFIGHYQAKNLIHLLIDNNAYASTGGQKTLSDTVDFIQMAKACHYQEAIQVKSESQLVTAIQGCKKGPMLILVKVACVSCDHVGRPKITPLKNKKLLMDLCHEKKTSS